MPKPPPSPPSSDIAGVNRGRGRVKARISDPDQQRKLAVVSEQTKARPPRDRDLGAKDNAQ